MAQKIRTVSRSAGKTLSVKLLMTKPKLGTYLWFVI